MNIILYCVYLEAKNVCVCVFVRGVFVQERICLFDELFN